MGFNGVRKHQKIEDPRYLYWADRLGLLVWEEMPSAYRFTTDSVERVTQRMDRGDRSATTATPASSRGCRSTNRGACRTCPTTPTERHYVQALYHLTKTLDPTRPVIGNDGWESVATDIIGIHDYDADPERLARRYHAGRGRARGSSGASGRAAGCWCSAGTHAREHPIVLSEFGGIALVASRNAVGIRPFRPTPRARRALRRTAAGGAVARAAERVLLHAVRRHVPGSQRPAVCRPRGRSFRWSRSRAPHVARHDASATAVESDWHLRIPDRVERSSPTRSSNDDRPLSCNAVASRVAHRSCNRRHGMLIRLTPGSASGSLRGSDVCDPSI